MSAAQAKRRRAMNDRERALAVLNYQPYDRLPIVHFGFWGDTLPKWAAEGYLHPEEAASWGDGSPADVVVGRKLGFDFNWYTVFAPATRLNPPFEEKVLERMPDGSVKSVTDEGVIAVTKPGTVSIPQMVHHLLKTRKAWQEHYLPRLQFSKDRVERALVRVGDRMIPFGEGGREFLQEGDRDYVYGLHLGSLYGVIRNWLTWEGSCYLLADDETLFTEIIDTVGELCYQTAKYVFDTGAKFDFAHYWEDICFRSGPLISPSVFDEKVGPHYGRINALVASHGINITSLDCDGKIDALIPTWVKNGVNTMFPIEVGTWGASIKPWREKYGKDLRGVGGTNKLVFARDRAAVDAEIERLKPLVELGGYIPCPDHRIAPGAKWDNVRYYCDRMRQVFG